MLSKTGTQDDTVLFGSFDINMGALVKVSIEGKQDDDKLFPQGMQNYKLDFEKAARLLGLGPLNLVTYQARHGGATRDILMQRREMEEVRKRGQWRTYSSVRRYEKSGRVHKVLQTTPPQTMQYCESVERGLLGLLLGAPDDVPAPPYEEKSVRSAPTVTRGSASQHRRRCATASTSSK